MSAERSVFTYKQKVLFLFAHMDDEAILSYGAIMRAADEGADVAVCCACGKGRAFRSPGYDEKAARRRRAVFSSLGRRVRLESGPYFDLGLDRAAAQGFFDEAVAMHTPEIVVTHWAGDLHFEHRLLAEASLVSCRRSPSSPVMQLWHAASPVEKWTYGQLGRPFVPNMFVDIGDYARDKARVLGRYTKCELPRPPDLRSAESVARFDAQNGSAAGLESAEAYFKVFEVA